jgi:tellurite resistance protein
VTLSNTPWLSRFPVGLFAISVGLLALAGAWRRAQGFGWEHAASVGQLLAWSGVCVFGLLLALYLLKCVRHPASVRAEFLHPLPGAQMALIPLSVLLLTVFFARPGDAGWLAGTLVALAFQGLVAIRIVAILSVGGLPSPAITPALYIPPVAGGLVGAMALSTLGYPGWAALLFGMGLVSWGLLEVRVLNRLFEGAMPEALRPTIGMELAPPAVATLAAATIWPLLPGDVLIVGLGIAAGPVVAVLARYRWWSTVPFAIGFWSFSFPLAAFAGAVIEVVRRGGWPAQVGAMALAIASAVIAFLMLRTLLLLLRGRLIPASPPSSLAPQKPSSPGTGPDRG